MLTRFISFAVWSLSTRVIPDVQATCILSDTLSTQPQLSNNALASGYENFTVKACFNSTSYSTCSWNYGSFSETFFTIFLRCYMMISTSIKCSETDGIVDTNLTLQGPVSIGNYVFTMCCRNGDDSVNVCPLNLSATVFVQDCPSSLANNGLEVHATSYQYGSQGNFSCFENHKLFDGSGVYKNDSSTTCNKFAEWEDAEGLQCWTAPKVSLTTYASTDEEIVNVTNGTDLSFNCEYENVIPSGNRSAFNYNGEKTLELKGEPFNISNVNKHDHDKFIFCQAVTDYTEAFKEEGKSKTLRFNVLYQPFNNEPETVCEWILNTTDHCNVSFLSNPHAAFKKLLLNEIIIATELNTSNLGISVTNGFQQVFWYHASQVFHNQSGDYTVVLITPGFQSTTNLTFKIIVVNQLTTTESLESTTFISTISPTTPSDYLVIVIVSCVGGVLLILIAILVFLFVRRRQENKSENETPRVEVASPIYETSGVVGSDSRETKYNEMYGKLNSSEPMKEIKANELYSYNAMHNPAMDMIEPIYQAAGSSEITSPKEESQAEPTEKAAAMYGVVNEGNKKNDERTTSLAEDNIKALYGQINMANKKKRKA